jgi:hypothetical protein
MQRPATIRPGTSHSIDVRLLHEPFATLAEAENAARRQAEFEQEYPWTAVYVVEAPHWRRAQHLPNPNDGEYYRRHFAIHRAAMIDPEGRVPDPTDRLSAFQPPKTRPGPVTPSALPPAAFSDPDVQRSLDALVAAGFEAVAYDHSAYFEDRPEYIPAKSAIERLRQQPRRLSGHPQGTTAQRVIDSLIRSPADVRGVAQRCGVYERDGEHEIGKLSIIEFQTGESIDAFIYEVEERHQVVLTTLPETPRLQSDSSDSRNVHRFQTDRLLVFLWMWFPEDGQLAPIVAALQPVLGPATLLR